MMVEECKRAGRWFRHCDWETMYDIVKPHKELASSAFFSDAEDLNPEMVEALIVRKTYAGALCRTCGKYIPRGGDDA